MARRFAGSLKIWFMVLTRVLQHVGRKKKKIRNSHNVVMLSGGIMFSWSAAGKYLVQAPCQNK